MAYVLNALLVPPQIASAVAARVDGAQVVALAASIAMIPLSADLLERIAGEDGAVAASDAMPYRLNNSLERTLVELSQFGPLAYVEAEHFGGPGEEFCMAWWEGEPALGPYEGEGAINSVLRWLGVRAEAGKDEFDTAGLGRFRSTEDWLHP